MFREPEAVEEEAVRKLDQTAPTRTSIRRQRNVRYPARNRRDRTSSSRSRSQRHYERLLQEIRNREGAQVLAAELQAERAMNIETSANQAHAEASRRRRLENGRATLRDALSYEQPHQSMSMRQSYALSMMRPPIASAISSTNPFRRSLRRPVNGENGHGILNFQPPVEENPPAYIPSPPYSSGNRSNPSSPDVLRTANGAASLSPRFAPARSLPNVNSITEQAQLSQRSLTPADVANDDSTLTELPLLRRMSRSHAVRHSPREARQESSLQNVVDGLGDRWRSVSPDEDSWDTLLSTMPLDERLPSSTSSSFRSSADLAGYEGLTNTNESTADAMDLYPVNCENTDSELSVSTDDDIEIVRRLARRDGSHTVEYHDDDISAIHQSLRTLRDGSTSQLLRRVRNEARRGSSRALLPGRIRNAGRSGWERL
ncbi:MAG: hypothetical protein L6R41_001491 [Letrouitia leprolyta]|nr:MAG: hypothetical protein L6R41_001491 [Letrouitia leprolyta]